VAVVPAGVHLAGRLRLVLEAVGFGDVEGVHVRAQPDHRPLARPQRPHDPGSRQAAMDLDPELGKPAGHEFGRRPLFEGGFWMGMKMASPGDHVGMEAGDAVDDGHSSLSKAVRAKGGRDVATASMQQGMRGRHFKRARASASTRLPPRAHTVR